MRIVRRYRNVFGKNHATKYYKTSADRKHVVIHSQTTDAYLNYKEYSSVEYLHANGTWGIFVLLVRVSSLVWLIGCVRRLRRSSTDRTTWLCRRRIVARCSKLIKWTTFVSVRNRLVYASQSNPQPTQLKDRQDSLRAELHGVCQGYQGLGWNQGDSAADCRHFTCVIHLKLQHPLTLLVRLAGSPRLRLDT